MVKRGVFLPKNSVSHRQDSLYPQENLARSSPLFGSVLGDKASHYVSNAFELIAAASFGATHRKEIVVTEQGSVGYPDLVDVRAKRAHEVKAVSLRQTLDLRDNQVEYLEHFQRTHQSYRVGCAVFRYTPLPYSFSECSPEEVNEHLRQSISYGLVLPFSVIHELHHATLRSPGRKTPFSYRYEGNLNARDPRKMWKPRTRIKPPYLDALVHDPQKGLIDFGLDPANYSIAEQRMSSKFKLYDKPVKPFPIVVIKDRHLRRWVTSFVDSLGKRSEEYDGCSDQPESYSSLQSDVQRDGVAPF